MTLSYDPVKVIQMEKHGQTNTIESIYSNSFECKVFRVLRNYIWFFPAFLSIWLPCVNLLYPFAVMHGTVEPVFPYNSDFGTVSPALFGQFLDLTSIFVAISGFIRYKQIRYYLEKKISPGSANVSQITRLFDVNFLSILVICFSSFAQFVAGNFSADIWSFVHYVAIGSATSSLSFYTYLMFYITKNLSKFGLESRPTSLKLVTIMCLSVGGLCIVFAVASLVSSEGQLFDAQYRLHWNRSQPGYWSHVISAVLDWIQMAFYSMFYWCLARRMKLFKEWDNIFA